MKTSRVSRTLAAVAAVACLASLPMAAQSSGPAGPGGRPPGGRGQMPPGMGPGGGPGWMGLVMGVDLTEQQATDIRAILDEQRESVRALHEQARTAEEKLATAIYSGTTDTADLVTQVVEAQRKMMESDVAVQLKVSALLTDAQRTKVLTRIKLGPPRGGPPPQP